MILGVVNLYVTGAKVDYHLAKSPR
jgi:hypothetical protein